MEPSHLPHRVFGALYVENPPECLQPDELNKYNELRPFLDELELGIDPTPKCDYEQEFRRFQSEETALWKAHGISRRKDELVPMSGNLQTARWLHHLHNPSFTTLNVHNGETADGSNPCIALVMGNVRDSDAVIFDHTFRREIVDPFIKYPEDILLCHERHLATIRQHSTAPVEVVYGRLARTRMLQTLNLTRLKLWGSYADCEIFLEWQGKNDNRHAKKLLRLVVFVYHPQCFLQAWGGQWALQQDHLMAVASKLSKVNVRADFYQAGWQNTIDLLPYATYLQNQPFAEAARRAILNLGQTGDENTSLNSDNHNCIDYPSTAASRPGEHRSFEAVETTQFGNGTSNENILVLKDRENAWRSMIRSSDDTAQLPQVVVCMCINCWEEGQIGPKRSTLAIDNKPRWTKGSPARYIERTAECWTCQTQRRLVSLDQSIPSVTSNYMAKFWKENSSLIESEQISLLQDLKGAVKIHRSQKLGKNLNRSKREYKRDSSLEDEIERDAKRPVMKVKCRNCQRRGAADTNAEWEKTTGNYIARTRLTCESNACKQKARLFVPTDSSVMYTSYQALKMRAFRNSKYD